jgi:hypothetical protein
LFLVQPMFAKMVLPLLGGAPAVWTTCMLFFQSGLLAGYAYAHAIGRWGRVRAASAVHAVVILLPLAMLPVAPPADATAVDELRPVAWLLRLMLLSVGLPFVVLSTTAPLLQQWFVLADPKAGRDPYFLYAASNAGSLIALIAFPSLIEPLLPVTRQSQLWTAGYVVFAALVLGCLGAVFRSAKAGTAAADAADPPEEVPSIGRQLEWLALSFIPSSLMLAVTTYLSTDVAAVPLLWIVPLVIYLAAFILAFGGHRAGATRLAARALPLVLLPLLMLLVAQGEAAWWFALPLHLASFGALSLLCLGRLVEQRPGTAHLTRFYLWLATGGALGGVFNTIVAPALFSGVAEYPIVIAAACFLLAAGSGLLRVLRAPRLLVKPLVVGLLTLAGLMLNQRLGAEPQGLFLFLGVPAVLCFSLSRDRARFAYAVGFLLIAGVLGETPAWGRVLHAERTFFGVYRISESADGRYVTLYHGTTVHGRQARGSGRPEPLTYYRTESPIADVLNTVGRFPRSVGVVGLGVGSLASYERPGDGWTFYEIDPAVERLARDARFFTYLAACRTCDVVVGDARVSLEASDVVHDLLVLDAFSSDAIPIHLLTREAFDAYARRLAPGGVLAVHISNRHVELRPVLARLARDLGWAAVGRYDVVPEALQARYSSSEWVAMAPDPGSLAALERRPQWTALEADHGPAWSDDFSNIWTALRWR